MGSNAATIKGRILSLLQRAADADHPQALELHDALAKEVIALCDVASRLENDVGTLSRDLQDLKKSPGGRP
jgi:hypothetical protein